MRHTAASLVFARFANRVDSRTAGLVAGAVLTLLGAALILLHYWEQIKAVPLLYGVLSCTLEFLEYIVPAAILLLCLHHFFKIPSHVFRKLLHLAAFTCLVEMMWAVEEWYQASLTALLFAAAVYPLTAAALPPQGGQRPPEQSFAEGECREMTRGVGRRKATGTVVRRIRMTSPNVGRQTCFCSRCP